MDVDKLFATWKSNQIAIKDTDLGEINIDELVSSIFSAGPTYYYVIDFYTMTLSHVSSTIKEIHGVDPDTVTFSDILNLIHPEDVDFVSKTEQKAAELFDNIIGRDKLIKYKFNFCIRFKVHTGEYKLFLHQSLVLTLDEHGGFGKSLNIHTDISHLTTVNNYKVSFVGLLGEPSYTNIQIYEGNDSTTNYTSYSKREIEVLKLIGEGLTNSEISKRLHIALDTAKNHRRNILDKAGVKNTAQLIKKSILEGLI